MAEPSLRPAEFDERDAWKFRVLVAMMCVSEAWAVVLGSGILRALWPIRWGTVGSVALVLSIVGGSQIEQWLDIVSGEPILNEKGEIARMPSVWHFIYWVPPFIAIIGGFLVMFHRALPMIAGALSLAVFGWLMLRVWRIWNGRPSKASDRNGS